MRDKMSRLILENSLDLTRLEKMLGYNFTNRKLLQQALIHRSYAYEAPGDKPEDNETLEFLGDAVLDLTVGTALYERYRDYGEGRLTRMRSSLVNESHLALLANEIDLGSHLQLGKGEENSNGREKPSILASTFEAIAGAIFLDGGYEAAASFVNEIFRAWFEKCMDTNSQFDSKTRLQEVLQERYNQAPRYELENQQGPDHAKRFTVSVRFQGRTLGTGVAGNKKQAEKIAASMALEQLEAENFERS